MVELSVIFTSDRPVLFAKKVIDDTKLASDITPPETLPKIRTVPFVLS